MTNEGDSERDRPTEPPGPPDPLMAIAMRLEQKADDQVEKIDRLTGVAHACFNELQEQKKALDELRGRVEALERVPAHTNGSAAP